MSQFMNNAKRVKGWNEVEAKLDQWIKEFKRPNKSSRVSFLNKIYTAKTSRPDRPVVKNIYQQCAKSKLRVADLDSPTQEIPTFINACNSIEEKYSHYSLSEAEDNNDTDSCISLLSKDSEQNLDPDEADWSSFEINKVFHM